MADALRHQPGQLHAVEHEDIELPILEHTTALSDGCDRRAQPPTCIGGFETSCLRLSCALQASGSATTTLHSVILILLCGAKQPQCHPVASPL